MFEATFRGEVSIVGQMRRGKEELFLTNHSTRSGHMGRCWIKGSLESAREKLQQYQEASNGQIRVPHEIHADVARQRRLDERKRLVLSRELLSRGMTSSEALSEEARVVPDHYLRFPWPGFCPVASPFRSEARGARSPARAVPARPVRRRVNAPLAREGKRRPSLPTFCRCPQPYRSETC